MNQIRMRSFVFGKDRRPWWFLQKVDSKDVEYIYCGKKIIGCRFYHIITRREFIIIRGQTVTTDMLYSEEPRREYKEKRRRRK